MVKDREMNGTSQNCFDFFKVYLPECSSERLIIPGAFIARLDRLWPGKAVLRNRVNKIWHVEVGRIDNELFFHNGWKKFVKDNSIEEGDFLVFRYNGDRVFDVKLFGNSATEKGSSYIKEEEEEEDVVVVDEEEGEEDVVPVVEEEDVVEEEEDVVVMDEEEDVVVMDEEEEEEEEDDDDEEEEEEEDQEDEDDDYDDYEEEEEEEDEEEEIEEEEEEGASGGANTVNKSKGQKKIGRNNHGEYTGMATGKFKGKHKGTALVKIEEVEVRKYIDPINPYWVTKLRNTRKNSLYVPVDVMRDHNLTLPKQMIFLDEHGRNWPGELSIWKDGRTWIEGWLKVCKWNHVTKSDTCICEYLQGRGQRGNVIKVHIVREGSGH